MPRLTEVELKEHLDDFEAWVRGGKTPEDAERRLASIMRDPEAARQVREEYTRLCNQFIYLGWDEDKNVILTPGCDPLETWYAGPDHPSAWCWPVYRSLAQFDKWQPDDVRVLDEASTDLLAQMAYPGRSFSIRGLVLGYVQSSKTANYAALIAKAADAGYRLFIVLAGTTSSLRRQTQERLEKDILSHHTRYWTKLTTSLADFSAMPGHPDQLLSGGVAQSRIICVVKKNATILQRLHGFLSKASPLILENCPAIIIDDEADNASINTNRNPNATTAINGWIRSILDLMPNKSAYVGYTATPFANIFIDPTDAAGLFPRHFIASLPRPKDYFGSERIFGRGLLEHEEKGSKFEGMDVIRLVRTPQVTERETVDEPSMLRPTRAADRYDFDVQLPDSLKYAIRYFILATACRYARGQSYEHSTMLAHTSQYVELHSKTKEAIILYVNQLSLEIHSGALGSLQELWEREMESTSQHIDGKTVDFDELKQYLPQVCQRCKVVVDNGLLGHELIYPSSEDHDPRVYIAVGGNTLSRGLTLEGLVVSYFIRVAKTYDTLLQMGRWFGFRRGYMDLPRIWLTAELQTDFQFLAGVEEELRHAIRRLKAEKKTPLNLRIKIRTHPRLRITAKNKMGAADLVSSSYSNERIQTTFFNEKDADLLLINIEATRELIRTTSNCKRREGNKEGSILYEKVPVDSVIKFLTAYQFNETQVDFKQNLLLEYIKKENQKNSLKHWNITIVGRSNRLEELGDIDLGTGAAIPCISRSRYRTTGKCNIKALVTASDRVIDIESVPSGLDSDGMIAIRNSNLPGVGLLLLYPISKDSAPSKRDEAWTQKECPLCREIHWCPQSDITRHLLHASEHVIGVAIVFPESKYDDSDYQANVLVGNQDVESGDEELDEELDETLEAAFANENEVDG